MLVVTLRDIHGHDTKYKYSIGENLFFLLQPKYSHIRVLFSTFLSHFLIPYFFDDSVQDPFKKQFALEKTVSIKGTMDTEQMREIPFLDI